jgi:lipopolysaccharide/colanic/teichoic acid biosynthesis glycosyltransferase/peptidoglycan/xylan/chitin deacetylase (PgdA/CDA1 family)
MSRSDRHVPLRRAPRVLMYHYFGEATGADPEQLFVTEAAFAAQLRHLRRSGWRALTLDEYLAALDGAPTPRRSYLLTIDDGHESAVGVAAPALAEAGVPSVLFVCPDRVGGRAEWTDGYQHERLAPAEELKGLPDLGMELGVHSADHTRMIGMDDETLQVHIADARDRLEATTGVRARSFAYPYGTHDAAARAAVAAAGYDVAFAVAREHGRFAVDRVFVRSTDSLALFRFKLSLPYRIASRIGGRAWRLRHAARAAGAAVRSIGAQARFRGSQARTSTQGKGVSGRGAGLVRRVIDVAVSAALLAVLALPMLAIALAIRTESRGPALFRQERVGLHRRPFVMLKFRTMRPGGDDAALRDLIARELRGEDTVVDGSSKLNGDTRITRVGRFLRRTSLDELPQLINVLRGDMTLVGPRPCLDWEAEMFPAEYAARFDVTPGLTGLWQVSGRSSLGTLDMLRLDVRYVEHRTLRRDIAILLRTIPSLLGGGGSR